ncbi:MAG: hypothetical protein EBY26_06055, partial [Microbacteriaceae bacterium]|nr:hypothetical protein [Microbacteriaceae bacterium]
MTSQENKTLSLYSLLVHLSYTGVSYIKNQLRSRFGFEMLERLGINMTKTAKIYAWILVLALFAGTYSYFSSPSRAEVTQGSDAPIYLYGPDHMINEGDEVSRPFDGDAYASASDESVSIPFVCPDNASGASTFISPRGKKRD